MHSIRNDLRKYMRKKTQKMAMLAASLAVFAPTTLSLAEKQPEVMYGEDDRQELYELSTQSHDIKQWAGATALLTFKSNLSTSVLPHLSKLKTTTLQNTHNVCQDEPYAQQPIGGWCSGFLVQDDVFITAGHCVPNESRCQNTALIFDYGYFLSKDEATKDEVQFVKEENIFFCKKIIAQKTEYPRGLDYAVIQLDRKVLGRKPLKIRTSGRIESTASLTVIGHPAGLPTKVARGGYVRDNQVAHYFETNTDTYGGNSGSPVLNNQGIVEGILVRGESDFEPRGDCLVSKRCEEKDCRGEDATRTTEFSALIPL